MLTRMPSRYHKDRYDAAVPVYVGASTDSYVYSPDVIGSQKFMWISSIDLDRHAYWCGLKRALIQHEGLTAG